MASKLEVMHLIVTLLDLKTTTDILAFYYKKRVLSLEQYHLSLSILPTVNAEILQWFKSLNELNCIISGHMRKTSYLPMCVECWVTKMKSQPNHFCAYWTLLVVCFCFKDWFADLWLRQNPSLPSSDAKLSMLCVYVRELILIKFFLTYILYQIVSIPLFIFN